MSKPVIGLTAERQPYSASRPDLLLHAVLSTYIDAVQGAGGIPVILPLGLPEDDLAALYAQVQAVLIPGGGDIAPHWYHAALHPRTNSVDEARDQAEIFLTRRALADGKPYLGVCRGAQVMNVALGGTLYQDLPSELPGSLGHMFRSSEYPSDHPGHSVQIAEDSLLARIVGQPVAAVNSRHHQALKDIAPGLEVVARAPDEVIEAVEARAHPFALGVQWHPENLQADPGMKALFEQLVAAARR